MAGAEIRHRHAAEINFAECRLGFVQLSEVCHEVGPFILWGVRSQGGFGATEDLVVYALKRVSKRDKGLTRDPYDEERLEVLGCLEVDAPEGTKGATDRLGPNLQSRHKGE